MHVPPDRLVLSVVADQDLEGWIVLSECRLERFSQISEPAQSRDCNREEGARQERQPRCSVFKTAR